MAKTLENQHWNTLIEVVQRSYQIKKHLDFFRWQQDDVAKVFPHDGLIAVWGDFSKGILNYDVSSNIPGVRTQKLRESASQVDQFMADLYNKWLANNERWYRINNFSINTDADDLPNFFSNELSEINSLLVYGVRDIRGNNDCLYVFVDKKSEFSITSSVLGMLMPHLDAALRRIECLESTETEDDDIAEYHVQGLSDREHEIIHWVRMGKTNFEISMILGISPNTVKNHLKRIFSKLDVTCRAQAVATYIPPKIN